MEENTFRIGGVYRQRNGAVVELHDVSRWDGGGRQDGIGFAWFVNSDFDDDGARALKTGRYVYAQDADDCPYHLIPGELQQVCGEWVRVKEAAYTPEQLAWILYGKKATEKVDPNAAMIARDGPAQDFAAIEREHLGDPDKLTGIYAPKAHAPIAGLTRVSGFSHLLGAGVR